MNSNDTGRMARSMQEGINPYASGPIEPMREPAARRFADWALAAAALLAIIVIVGVSV